MMDKFDVGIIDLEIYVPMFYVEQSDLEHHDCCDGKYVNGLGQTRMAVPSLVEDPVSMALTVVHRLMERVNLDYRLIGRLDVGTESSIDLSKSIKSQIMQLFQGSGNYSVEGADNINACYGGTAALFNVINWVRHTSNGSLGLVVTTDIAIYSNDESSARATGGAAAVCMLIGHNPILSIEVPCGSYMNNCYDFYKPLAIPYPMFDAKQSQIIYIKSLIKCSSEYMKSANFSLFDPKNLFALHCPYAKLVKKGFGYLKRYYETGPGVNDEIEELYENENQSKRVQLEKAMASDQKVIQELVLDPGLQYSKHIGNSYCSSLFVCLASILSQVSVDSLVDRRIVMYSYGSGCLSSMYSFRTVADIKALQYLQDTIKKQMERLTLRQLLIPETMISWADTRFNYNLYCTSVNAITDYTDHLFPNTFYIANIDEKFRRFYKLYI